jgi:hypothetical protein
VFNWKEDYLLFTSVTDGKSFHWTHDEKEQIHSYFSKWKRLGFFIILYNDVSTNAGVSQLQIIKHNQFITKALQMMRLGDLKHNSTAFIVIT